MDVGGHPSIFLSEIGNNYQADIMYLPQPTKNRYKYILTCIDVYSRKAWVEPIKLKNAEHALTALNKIFKKSKFPKNLNVDAGGEFDNIKFKKYTEDNDIKLWISNPEQHNKNSIVERFHRTLRNILLRYTTTLNKPYINELQKLVDNYNDTYHNTVEATPNSISNHHRLEKN
jgi:transposase InsO family protein